MRFTRLEANDVYGHLSFDISFDSRLTFLTGINGSGKTTALRLLSALFRPSVFELAEIPFSLTRLSFTEREFAHWIHAEKEKGNIRLSCSSTDDELTVTDIEDLDNHMSTASDSLAETHREILSRYREHPVMQFILSFHSPVFLGLEREHLAGSGHPLERRLGRLRSRFRRNFGGLLGPSLNEIENMFREFLLRMAREKDRLNEKLRQDVLLSAFEYVPISAARTGGGETVGVPGTLFDALNDILDRREEIVNILGQIGLPERKFTPVLDRFFRDISDQLDSVERVIHAASEGRQREPQDILIQDKDPEHILDLFLLAMNQPQIGRIIRLLKMAREHKRHLDELMEPVDNFFSLVNKFFQDSHKAVRIGERDTLQVDVSGSVSQGLDALSSGERQILVMLAHLSFNETLKDEGVFIVDEPELSLHLKWQEMFVHSVLTASPSTQVILATHSPEIIGEYYDHCVDLGVLDAPHAVIEGTESDSRPVPEME